MSCREWNVIQGPCNLCFIACELNLIYLANEVGIKYSRYMTIVMLQIFCTQSLPVLQNDQQIPITWHPCLVRDLSPCVTLSPTENSYICKYLASEDISNSNMTVESQIKLWGNGIFHSGRLVSLCYWAQQSKAAERVLDTQFKPFQTMHVYYFLVMVFLMIASWSWKASSASTS